MKPLQPNKNFDVQEFTPREKAQIRANIKSNQTVVSEFEQRITELERCISVCHSSEDSAYFYSLKMETEQCLKDIKACISIQERWLENGHPDPVDVEKLVKVTDHEDK